MSIIKPKLWVKSYPFPKEVSALADLVSQDIGMEVFLGGDRTKNEECLRICRDEYPRFGIELFCYVDEEKGERKVIYDPLSPDPIIRELSRSYLFGALELAVAHQATHLQLDGNNGYQGRPGQTKSKIDIARAIERKRELLAEIAKRFGDFPVYFENTIPIDDNASELVFSLTGHRLSDFTKGDLPLEYDIAHHAIALDVYSRADEFDLPLTEEERQLAQRVRQKGITNVILEELKHLPEIFFTHLCNASRFEPQTKSDTTPTDPSITLVNLEEVLPILMIKSRNITPEVGDDDFKLRPNLRQWIKRLQDM